MNISIYSFVVTTFLVMQLYVEWMRYQQRKSEEAATLTTTATLTTLSTNARNDLVLQKSGEGPSSPFRFLAFVSTKIDQIELPSVNQLLGKLCCLIYNPTISSEVPKFSYEP